MKHLDDILIQHINLLYILLWQNKDHVIHICPNRSG
uniref:Uncharacterized protein n=1 Tax=Lepeophtheirus salmonis TaxID=72036 RepID=A0A0K2TBH8_LEPSM